MQFIIIKWEKEALNILEINKFQTWIKNLFNCYIYKLPSIHLAVDSMVSYWHYYCSNTKTQTEEIDRKCNW